MTIRITNKNKVITNKLVFLYELCHTVRLRLSGSVD